MDEVIGTTIHDLYDYKLFITKKYGSDWFRSSYKKIYDTFGKPSKYPFTIIEIKNDNEDSWEDTKLVRVYY